MLKLAEHVGINIFLLYKQKTLWYSDIQNFYSEILNFLNFRLFFAKNHNFQARHVFILICMDREGPYLPIDTKIKFVGSSVLKI